MILIVGGVLLAIILWLDFHYKDLPDRVHILRIAGSVSIERANEQTSPIVGMFLKEKDQIITGEGSFVEVAYDDALKNVVRIGPNSTVVLKNARVGKQTELLMDKGEIMLKLNKLGKDSSFKVRTPIAVAGVRGTAFGVKISGKQVVITDYERRIFVKGLKENFSEMEEELLLSPGLKVQVGQFEKPKRVSVLTAEERAVWKAWLNEIDSLSLSTSVNNVFFINLMQVKQEIIYKPLTLLMMILMKITSSVSTLTIALYGLIAIDFLKRTEKAWL
jgi:hypothetical protein